MIKINRIKQAVDYDKIYRVYIDGVSVLDLHNGEMKDFYVASGNHTIEIKSDVFRSDKLSFNIGDEEIIEFHVKPDFKNTWFSKFIHKTIFMKLGIKIELSKAFYL